MDNSYYSNHIAGISRPDESEITLESILAEYKSEAFIDGDKRTPKAVLEERSRSIIMESISENLGSAQFGSTDSFPLRMAKTRQKTASRPQAASEIFSKDDFKNNGGDDWEEIPREELHMAYYTQTEKSNSASIEKSEGFFEREISQETYNDYSDGEYSSPVEDRYTYNKSDGPYQNYSHPEENNYIREQQERDSRHTGIKAQYSRSISGKKSSPLSRLRNRFQNIKNENEIYSESHSTNHVMYSSADELFEHEENQENAGNSVGRQQPQDEYSREIYGSADESGSYASNDYSYNSANSEKYEQYAPSGENRFLKTVIALFAAIITLRRHHESTGRVDAKALPEQERIPETPPSKAAKLYASQITPLKLRCYLAAGVSLILVYITYAFDFGLPLPGALSQNIKAASLMCLLMQMAVMMICLDVFTNGFMAFLRKQPGAESLIVLSCIASIIDAVILALILKRPPGLPFCAVSAVSLTCALFGSRFTCVGMRATFRAASISSTPNMVSAENGLIKDSTVLVRAERDLGGFVSRSEEADAIETAHIIITPFLIIAALVFSILSSIARGRAADFFHTYSAISAGCASFSALLSFALPFSVTARKLLREGAAIAGYSGAADIGKSRGILVKDGDIFPPSTISIDEIRIMEGTYTDKVISYTGSLLAASGSGVSPAFTEMMRKNGYAMHRVDDFSPHEGGGFVATIRGEQVYVGSSGFMKLIGIKLPRSFTANNVVFTAISGVLVGIISVRYSVKSSIQDELVSLINSGGSQYFAIRDFNLTPQLINQKYKLPAERFEFPSFSDRFKFAVSEDESTPCALLSRDKLGTMVDAFASGRRLYRASRLGGLISLLSSITGLLLIFFLCWNGAFDSACAGNILTFMFLWLVPVLVISMGLQR